jgi:hypothetical protein
VNPNIQLRSCESGILFVLDDFPRPFLGCCHSSSEFPTESDWQRVGQG